MLASDGRACVADASVRRPARTACCGAHCTAGGAPSTTRAAPPNNDGRGFETKAVKLTAHVRTARDASSHSNPSVPATC